MKNFGFIAAVCLGVLECGAGEGFSLTNEHVVLSIDAAGWSTQLVERATGRILSDGRVPFVRPECGYGKLLYAKSVEARGQNIWAWTYRNVPGEVVLAAKPFRGGWTFEVKSATVPGMTRLFLCCLRGVKCVRYTSGASQTVSDDASGIAIRGYDLHAITAVGLDTFAIVRPSDAPLEGRRVGFTAGPRTALFDALQAMTVEAVMPHSTAGGAWALASDRCRGSYLNANVTAATVDDWIALALRSGIDTIHFRERWYACRGHYPVNTNDWPNGLTDLKGAVAKVHAAGLHAGLHTLTGCIDPRDSWVTPRCSSNLLAWATYTLAAPLAPDALEMEIAEEPIARHDVAFTYHGNGNAIRIGDEIVQYTGVRRTKPYGFTGLVRGAFGTVPASHAQGTPADYLQQRYLAFYPKPDSPLARDLAEAIGNVYRTCGFDQIYCDGVEGMMSQYGMAKMRHLIIGACTADGRPCLTEDSAGGSGPACWWFHSRVGAWDSTYWAPKRFHDFHVADIRAREVRKRDLREIQMGWWSPVQWSPHNRPHCVDEMEYYAGKNAALDASMSVTVDLSRGPLNFGTARQMTVLGWYERFRRAGAFADGMAARLAVPRAEFRLRQDSDGAWRFAAVDCRPHRVHSAPVARWTLPLAASPEEGCLRIEALYAGVPYGSSNALAVLSAADVPTLVSTNAASMRSVVEEATDPVHGHIIRFSAENAGPAAEGAWACASREFRPYLRIGDRRVVAFWVKGDGSGALLNVQVMTPREYGLCRSEHYVTLDFTGWRYMEMPFRETDAETFCDHKWPYSKGYAEVFHRVINQNNVSAVNLYLNDVPPGGRAAACVSEVRLVPMRDAGCRDMVVTVNGRPLAVPFSLKSGEFAELGGGFWTHLDRSRTPLARIATAETQPLAAGTNTYSFAAAPLTPDAWPRAEVTAFAIGSRFDALRPLAELPPACRRLLEYEAVEPRFYAPASGFADMPPLVTRPGEHAEPSFEVAGPIDAFSVTVGDVTRAFPAVAAGKVFRSPEGAYPAFSGRTPVTVQTAAPASARAIFSFAKRYRPADGTAR